MYTMSYSQCDYGTERILTVKKDGRIIGQRDPFWPKGIPVSEKARNRRMQTVAQEIIKEYAAEVS